MPTEHAAARSAPTGYLGLMRATRLTQGLAAVLGLAAFPPLHAQAGDRALLVRAIDSIASAPIEDGRVAGMSVAVVHGNDTLALKGYGYADLELRVPTPDRAVYEIGSITKQFTAAAILQLAERGALSLDDELTKFLPEYPTRGHRVTVRRLLDHTSGIRGYTEIAEFDRLRPFDLPRDSAVAIFSSKPFDFTPGEAMIYNNSAYFLLGLIIEKTSGETYEAYVDKHLFEPAGMRDSRYCSEKELIERRAHGYERGSNGLRPKRYIVHVWPYAAGSLCSTVGDLVAWARAVHGNGAGGSLLSPTVYRELITPGTLNDGTRLRYAKGLSVAEIDGRRQISHGGGIFGFVSFAAYYPESDLIVVVLMNTAGTASPDAIATDIANRALGDPTPPVTGRYTGDATELAGTYTGPSRGIPMLLTVEADSTRVTVRRGGGERMVLEHLTGLTFVRGNTRYTFVRRDGKIDTLQVDQVSGLYVLKREEP